MDMQEPEKQRLEDQPVEPAEDVSTPPDDSVLSDTGASESDQEPASVSPSEDEAVESPVTAESDEESVNRNKPKGTSPVRLSKLISPPLDLISIEDPATVAASIDTFPPWVSMSKFCEVKMPSPF